MFEKLERCTIEIIEKLKECQKWDIIDELNNLQKYFELITSQKQDFMSIVAFMKQYCESIFTKIHLSFNALYSGQEHERVLMKKVCNVCWNSFQILLEVESKYFQIWDQCESIDSDLIEGILNDLMTQKSFLSKKLFENICLFLRSAEGEKKSNFLAFFGSSGKKDLFKKMSCSLVDKSEENLKYITIALVINKEPQFSTQLFKLNWKEIIQKIKEFAKEDIQREITDFFSLENQ